jgi:hypothetical protein
VDQEQVDKRKQMRQKYTYRSLDCILLLFHFEAHGKLKGKIKHAILRGERLKVVLS